MSEPIIRKGDQGDAVKRCQEFLNTHGYLVTTDSYFGPRHRI